MQAAVYPGGGAPLRIEQRPDPQPAPDQVLLKVQRCGICGTDLHMTAGHPQFDYPANFIPGHEYAGEIVEVGARVTQLRKGELIAALPSSGCGRADCPACRSGNLALCQRGVTLWGGFAEYIAIPAHVAIRLPSALSLADGALLEPLAVGLHGTRLAHIQPGARVLVLGAGSVALCTLYWARRLGAGRVVALSRAPRREALALQMGADRFLCYADDEIAEVAEALGGPPDIVFECAGAPGLLAKAIAHVRLLGQVVSLGFCTAADTLVPAAAASKGVSVHFRVGYSLSDFQYVADVMDAGHVDPKILISSEVALAALPAKFAQLRGPHGDTKVHVLPGQ